MKPTRTWILIADGARARIVERVGRRDELNPVPNQDHRNPAPPSRELGDDRPGRVYESAQSARHAIEPKRDPHRELERLFANQLADILANAKMNNEFDRLVIVAPPTTLGDLRKALSPNVRAAVTAEVGKDLTKIPNDEVLRHLETEAAI